MVFRRIKDYLTSLSLVGMIAGIVILAVALFLIAPIALLWSLNHLGLTNVEIFNLWNILAAAVLVLILGGASGSSE